MAVASTTDFRLPLSPTIDEALYPYFHSKGSYKELYNYNNPEVDKLLDDGRKVTKPMVAAMIPEEMQKIRDLLGADYGEGRYDEAAQIFADLVDNDTFVEFLTLPAYEKID